MDSPSFNISHISFLHFSAINLFIFFYDFIFNSLSFKEFNERLDEILEILEIQITHFETNRFIFVS